MPKRVKFEAAGNEEDYVLKCITCIHSYTRINESDTLFCSCRNNCNYEKKKTKKRTKDYD